MRTYPQRCPGPSQAHVGQVSPAAQRARRGG
jgi:hypothetical protein